MTLSEERALYNRRLLVQRMRELRDEIEKVSKEKAWLESEYRKVIDTLLFSEYD